MRKYSILDHGISSIEKFYLIAYVALISIAISCAPDVSKKYTDTFSWLVNWIPAARRMIQISQMPAKTLTWLLATFALAPFPILYSYTRMQKVLQWPSDRMKVAARGFLYIAIMITPWLFVTSYHYDINYGHRDYISLMCVSPLGLAMFGSFLSTVYMIFFSSLTIFVGSRLICMLKPLK